MSFAVDDSILANIKKQQDSDDDNGAENGDVEGDTFMEVLEGFNANEIDGSNLSCASHADDPLEGDQDDQLNKKEFPWLCAENDFLKPYTCGEEQDWRDAMLDLDVCKKDHVKSELKSSNGLIWKKLSPSPPIADDLPGFCPQGKGPAKGVANPLEAWHLLIDVPMLGHIVRNTNEVIKAVKKKEPYQRRSTDMTEIRAWLGLNYLCGVLRNSLHAGPTEELWTLELGNAIFRATMTYKRFEFLADCLRYADLGACAQSPLDQVGTLWEKLVINCRSYYASSDFCTINEYILNLGIDHSNPFDHALPSQPEIKGLRFITMCDARTMYISNAIVAAHLQPMDQEVYQLVSDIKSSRRCLCLNERFTSMDLMHKLKQCQLQVVGPLSQTDKDVPAELYYLIKIPQVWYTKNDAALIVGLDEDVTPTRCLLTNGLSARINAVKLFQTIKDSNCKAHELMSRYSTKHARTKIRKWSLEFFYFMLDLSAFNAWTLFRLSENGCAGIEQRDFQRQLGLYLTQQQLKQRMHMNIKIPLPLKLQIAEILGENVESLLNGLGSRISEATKLGVISAEKSSIPDGVILQTREIESRRRCRGCKSRKGTKIKTRCQQCLTPYCMRHLISRCESCSGYEIQSSNRHASTMEEPPMTTDDIDAAIE